VFWSFDLSRHDPQLLSSPVVILNPETKDEVRRLYFGAGLKNNAQALLYCLEDHRAPE